MIRNSSPKQLKNYVVPSYFGSKDFSRPCILVNLLIAVKNVFHALAACVVKE